MRTVVVCQPRLPRYREAFFDALRRRCREQDIELRLVHGQPAPGDASRHDEGWLPWADRVENLQLTVGGRTLLWQPLPRQFAAAELLVITQENRILSNYPLLADRLWSRRKVAYWGHGANLQSGMPDGWRERWKRMLLGRVDWWFAYTDLTRDILLAAGYPDERITVVHNAIDNDAFAADLAAVGDGEIAALRQKVGAGDTAPVGLFCGSLYAEKRLDFLVAAAERIHAALPGFRLVVIGDGPARGELAALIAGRPWLHATGALHGRDKAAWFRAADLMLNPGLVGLNILDAFGASLPLVTTRNARHSPEIAYLEHDRNGLMVEGDADDYAAAVVALLGDRKRIAAFRQEAFATAGHHTLAAMVENFAGGIIRSLATAAR